MSAANDEFDSIMALVHEMNSMGCTDNPYTTLTPEVCLIYSTIDFSVRFTQSYTQGRGGNRMQIAR